METDPEDMSFFKNERTTACIHMLNTRRPRILHAIESRDFARIQECIKDGESISHGTLGFELTPLQVAVLEKKHHMIETLKQLNADVNVKGLDMTALHVAALFGDAAVVHLLVGAGVRLEVGDWNQYTCLTFAVMFNQLDVAERILQLDNEGVLINRKDHDLRSPLVHAVCHQYPEMVRLLLSYGAKCTIEPDIMENGLTCLHFAADKGNLEIMKLLLETSPYVNALDNSQYTALHHAMVLDMPDIADMLRAAGASVEVVDLYGETALFTACRLGEVDMVEVLLNCDEVNCMRKNNSGMLPYDVTRTNSRSGRKIRAMLIEKLRANLENFGPLNTLSWSVLKALLKANQRE
ncbi:hypothetical protein ACOMHN_022701 [Nucella lapillus]